MFLLLFLLSLDDWQLGYTDSLYCSLILTCCRGKPGGVSLTFLSPLDLVKPLSSGWVADSDHHSLLPFSGVNEDWLGWLLSTTCHMGQRLQQWRCGHMGDTSQSDKNGPTMRWLGDKFEVKGFQKLFVTCLRKMRFNFVFNNQWKTTEVVNYWYFYNWGVKICQKLFLLLLLFLIENKHTASF